MKLKTKLSLVFASVVLAIVVIVGSVSYNNSAKIGTTDAKNTMQTSADLVSEEKLTEIDTSIKECNDSARIFHVSALRGIGEETWREIFA